MKNEMFNLKAMLKLRIKDKLLFTAFTIFILCGVYFVLNGIMLIKASYAEVGILDIITSVLLIVISVIGMKLLCFERRDTKELRRLHMKDKLRFCAEVINELENTTICCIIFVLFIIISGIMTLFTKNIVVSIGISLGSLVAVCIIGSILKALYDAVTDIIDTVGYIKRSTICSSLCKSPGYINLRSILENAGETYIVSYLDRSEFILNESGHFSASLACHKKIDLFYPPLSAEWYIIIHDFNTNECYMYTESSQASKLLPDKNE